MQRWEHATITMEVKTGGIFQSASARLIIYKVPKAQIFDIKPDKSQGDRHVPDAVVRQIAQMGLDGWEIVAAQGEHLLYFKRPLL